MNIEEAIKQLKKHKAEIDKEYISARYSKAIEILLTAYEKEKEKNKELQELYTGALQDWGNEKEKNKELEKIIDEISEIHFPIIY